MPVVLIFHGGGANAAGMVRFCGLNDKADQAGFIAVYPNGTGNLERGLDLQRRQLLRLRTSQQRGRRGAFVPRTAR